MFGMNSSNYRTISDFPQWVHDYNHWGERKGWPKEYQHIADEIYKKADEVVVRLKPAKKYVNSSPYSQGEINNRMKAREDFYEDYPVFACSEGVRPDEWDHVYDSGYDFSRGGFIETKIGNWYFLLGFDYD